MAELEAGSLKRSDAWGMDEERGWASAAFGAPVSVRAAANAAAPRKDRLVKAA